MIAIYKRELKSCLQSFIGFLFIGVILFFVGLYFTLYNLFSGYPYFSYPLSSVSFLFLLSVPILTMRILAEERKNKTDQLILTAPVSVGGIVMGKFLAMVTVFAIPIGIMCIYPLIMNHFGSIPMGEAYLSIFAFFLYGVASIAIGILISSITESQVIAAVISFAVLFLGYMMSGICALISTTGNVLTIILSCFDMYTPFSDLLSGTLNVQSIFYFVALTALALFLTTQLIQKRRYNVSVKNFRIGAYSTGMIALAIIAVIAANMVLSEMPGSWTTIDITNEKIYSLTQTSTDFVKTLDEDVVIYAIVKEDNKDITLDQTLQRYQDLSKHITVEYIDPQVNPRFHAQYTSSTISMNSLIVVSDKRSRVIDYSEIYENSYDYNTNTSTTTGYDGEGQITSALGYVISEDMPKVYLTDGHGELALSDSFGGALAKENVTYESINLLQHEEIPEDAACVLVHAPVNDFSKDDATKLIAYLEKGGKVVWIAGYTEEETPNNDEILSYMGLEIADGLLIEQEQNHYYMNPFYLLPNVESSVYTNAIYNQYYVFAPFAQGIIIRGSDTENLEYQSFLTTSEAAFSRVDMQVENYEKIDGDIEGPFSLGVEARKTLDEGEAVFVLYSCSQLFTDEASSMVSGANLSVFTSTISNFVEHENSVSVPVKNYTVSSVVIAQSQAVILGVITSFVLPIGCLLIGFIIWFRRRRR